jgi:hypothetical protein
VAELADAQRKMLGDSSGGYALEVPFNLLNDALEQVREPEAGGATALAF